MSWLFCLERILYFSKIFLAGASLRIKPDAEKLDQSIIVNKTLENTRNVLSLRKIKVECLLKRTRTNNVNALFNEV